MRLEHKARVGSGLAWLLVAFAPCAWPDHEFGVRVDSIRCDGEVVQVGDHSYQLLDTCGSPDYRDVVELRRANVRVRGPAGGAAVELGIGELQVVEEWVYKPGPGRLTRVLTVVGGVLTDIRLAERN